MEYIISLICINLNSSCGYYRNIEFQGAWFADPVFFGRYPQSMVDRVGTRLPSFTPEQSERLIRSSDFYGLNHYTSKYVSNCPFTGDLSNGWGDDQETCVSKYDSNGNIIGAQAASDWLQVVPSGIHDILLWVQKRYNNPVILITENGVDVPGESDLSLEDALHDTFRIDFYSGNTVHGIVDSNWFERTHLSIIVVAFLCCVMLW